MARKNDPINLTETEQQLINDPKLGRRLLRGGELSAEELPLDIQRKYDLSPTQRIRFRPELLEDVQTTVGRGMEKSDVLGVRSKPAGKVEDTQLTTLKQILSAIDTLAKPVATKTPIEQPLDTLPKKPSKLQEIGTKVMEALGFTKNTPESEINKWLPVFLTELTEKGVRQGSAEPITVSTRPPVERLTSDIQKGIAPLISPRSQEQEVTTQVKQQLAQQLGLTQEQLASLFLQGKTTPTATQGFGTVSLGSGRYRISPSGQIVKIGG